MTTRPPETVADYLAALPEERRAVLQTVRDGILAVLPEGYVEQLNYGMISYDVPLSRYPDTYHGKPLSMVAIAAQKRHYGIYLNCIYHDPAKHRELLAAYEARGLRPDLGKACIRFTKLEQLPLDVILEIIAAMDVETFVAGCEAARSGHRGTC